MFFALSFRRRQLKGFRWQHAETYDSQPETCDSVPACTEKLSTDELGVGDTGHVSLALEKVDTEDPLLRFGHLVVCECHGCKTLLLSIVL